jgi:hypothetical protein
VKFYVLGGNSLTNASIAINPNNASYNAGSAISVDAGTEAII